MKTAIEMAREAGIRDCTCNGTLGCLERFAEFVRADEREQLAQLADKLEWSDNKGVASAIRARSET